MVIEPVQCRHLYSSFTIFLLDIDMGIAINQPYARRQPTRILPGFGLSLGFAILYLSLIVLIPLAAVFMKSATMGSGAFWKAVTDPEVVAAYKLTFAASLGAAILNLVFGLLIAWVLARYRFPGRRLLDGLVDLPFALPTAVAGIALTTVYQQNGWIGHYLDRFGIHVAFTPLGVLVALIFVGLPYVVRTVQPVLQEFDIEVEEAAASLGASRWQTLRRVISPTLVPAAMTGFTLAFARGLGEYGSVVFISGNLPMKTEIVPLVIMSHLDEFDYAGATAIATVMLIASFALLLCINLLQAFSRRRLGEG